MTGSTHAPSTRAKVVALAAATALLAGGTFASASVTTAADHGSHTTQTVAGKWPVTKGKKW